VSWPAQRAAGVLLHPTSLPGPDGIGAAGRHARAFVDWAASAGFSVWQVLPLGPPGHGNAPYGCRSSFAGNPMLIDLDDLVEDGLLDRESLAGRPACPEGCVDVEAARTWKSTALRAAWDRHRAAPDAGVEADLEAFACGPPRSRWLDDWTLFRALEEAHGARPWTAWPRPLRDRDPEALRAAREELADALGYHRFVQFLFHRQWSGLRAHAADRGVRILGDVPIYTVLDSADVWAAPEYFRLDGSGRPEAVAGVPPDYFSETGQLWGNPLYRWERLREDGFGWWIERLEASLDHVDAVRLDHFRGFASCWEVPADATTAIDGRWVEGPGAALFDAVRDRLGGLPFVAEDLGVITDDVHRLREGLGLPGMKVLQFGFDDPDSIHRFDRVPETDLVYTGTHDNDTARGWFESLDDDGRHRVQVALSSPPERIVEAMVAAAYRSPARLAVVPVQDLLGLDSRARMNTPGVEDGNWLWRLEPGLLDDDLAARMHDLARGTRRFPA
jgi:4-alpha-glucanotransferase